MQAELAAARLEIARLNGQNPVPRPQFMNAYVGPSVIRPHFTNMPPIALGSFASGSQFANASAASVAGSSAVTRPRAFQPHFPLECHRMSCFLSKSPYPQITTMVTNLPPPPPLPTLPFMTFLRNL